MSRLCVYVGQDWLRATPSVWLVKGTGAGLLHTTRNLSYLLIRDSGECRRTD